MSVGRSADRSAPAETVADWSCTVRTEDDMLQLGALLVAGMPRGEPQALRVNLQGDLGAGKTTLARGVLRSLGLAGPVRSPSYALLELHEPPGWRVLHVDLYRMSSPEDLATLGLADYDLPDTLWLVEWPEKGGSALPAPDLRVQMAAGPAGHPVRVSAHSEAGRRWLGNLRNCPQVANFS